MRFEGPFCDICIVRGEHFVALVGARDGTGDRAADKSLRLGTFPSQVTPTGLKILNFYFDLRSLIEKKLTLL